MKGYKTIDQFNLRECVAFLKSSPGSIYEELVKQRYAKLCEEQQKIVQKKRQREQQEIYEQAAKANRRKKRNGFLLAVLSILVIAAGILIYFTYTN